MSDDPRRDPYVRGSDALRQVVVVDHPKVFVDAPEQTVEFSVIQDPTSWTPQGERYRALPQAFHMGTYVLQRKGERYPCAHCVARDYTEALLRFGKSHGKVGLDEVRRTR